MKTRLEQIEKKIRLSKAIDMNYTTWNTSIDENTKNSLINGGYSVDKDYLWELYVISW